MFFFYIFIFSLCMEKVILGIYGERKKNCWWWGNHKFFNTTFLKLLIKFNLLISSSALTFNLNLASTTYQYRLIKFFDDFHKFQKKIVLAHNKRLFLNKYVCMFLFFLRYIDFRDKHFLWITQKLHALF